LINYFANKILVFQDKFLKLIKEKGIMKGKISFTIWNVFLVVICLLISCTHTQRLSDLNNVSLNKNITVYDKRPLEDIVQVPRVYVTIKLAPSPKIYLHEQLSIKLNYESNKNTIIKITIKQINLHISGTIKLLYTAQLISDVKIVRNEKVINKEIITNGIFPTYSAYGPHGAKESTKRALDNLVKEVVENLKSQQSQWGPWIKIEDKKEQ
jgi:hypothetical protein